MRVAVAMSGGVDSSTAAYIMKERGYDCVGVTMLPFKNTDIVGEKNFEKDIEDAKKVADDLGIPYHVFDLSEQFRKCVMDRFVSFYERGMTPNPCVHCNKHLKFGALYEKARELGCEAVVTGHYARIEREDGKFILRKAADGSKDQTYMLCSLTQEQLSRTMFPLAKYGKDKVRRIALENGLINASKRDSQDICFVPDGSYAEFIKKYSGKDYPEGDFVDFDGNVLGRHRGIINYTIGQRRGIGIALSKPVYVCEIDVENNRVVLGEKERLFSREVLADDFSWISGEAPTEPIRCSAKIRYRHTEQPCKVWADGKSVKILFDEPQRAVTPGQSAVLYDGDRVLGGGIIIKGYSKF